MIKKITIVFVLLICSNFSFANNFDYLSNNYGERVFKTVNNDIVYEKTFCKQYKEKK